MRPETGADYLVEADSVIKGLKKSAKDGSRLHELTYSLPDLNAILKSMKTAIFDFKDFEKLYNRN